MSRVEYLENSMNYSDQCVHKHILHQLNQSTETGLCKYTYTTYDSKTIASKYNIKRNATNTTKTK